MKILFNLSSPSLPHQFSLSIFLQKDKEWHKMPDFSFKSKVTKILRAFSRSLSEWLVFPLTIWIRIETAWVIIFRWLVYVEDDLFSELSHFLGLTPSRHLQSLKKHDGEVLQPNKPLYDAQHWVIIQLHSAEYKYPKLVISHDICSPEDRFDGFPINVARGRICIISRGKWRIVAKLRAY